MEQIPTIGRIVHYHYDGASRPAIVIATHEDHSVVDLVVFGGHLGSAATRLKVPMAETGKNTWAWPPRV